MRKEIRKILIPLLMVQTVGALIGLSYAPLGPFIIRNLGLSPIEWGNIASVYFTGSIIVTIFAGVLVDRFSLRRMLSLSLAATGIIMSFAPALNTFTSLLVMFFLMGAAFSPIIPATNKGIVVGIPPSDHGFAMGTKTAGITLGQFFGAISLPVIVLSLGWQYTFLSLGIVCLGIGIIFYIVFPELSTSKPAQDSDARILPISQIINFPLISSLALGLAFYIFTITLTGFFLPLLQDSFGVTEIIGGLYLGILLLFSVLMQPLLGLASDRLFKGERKPLLLFCGIGGAIIGYTLASIPKTPSSFALTLISIGLGGTIFSCQGLFSSLIMDLSGPAQAGTVSGFATALTKLGGVIGPPIFGYLANINSYSSALQLFSLVLLIICIAAIFLPLEKLKAERPADWLEI